jgi:hypothetical protein
MGGGLMQLVAYGAQDIYLTGNPQITFFKVVYRRHTNFSMEAIQQTFSGTADFGNDVTATISRNGDLVYRMYLEHDAAFVAIQADDTLAISCDYGSHVMKECELEIGGQRIDKHYGHWHSVYSQLTQFNPSGSQTTLFNRMSGNGTGFSTENTSDGLNPNGFTSLDAGDSTEDTASAKLFIPLYFWFCRNPGLALPLIALQYHEVKVKITFEDLGNLIVQDSSADFGGATETKGVTANVTSKDFQLWADYIYLDTDERRRFAQVSHEYLIEQLQFVNEGTGGTIDLNFNHPVKELIWSGVRGTVFEGIEANVLYDRNTVFNAAITETAQLKLNGHDRFKERDLRYFTRTQVWESHTGYGCTQVGDTIAVYSFALKPEEHQPSGTCNFSRIDNAQLVQSVAQPVNIYAVNYNVLRIMSGMGGLAYSN